MAEPALDPKDPASQGYPEDKTVTPGFQAFDPAGKPINVPIEQATDLAKKGALRLPRGRLVPVRLSTGEVGTVPAEHLSQALSQDAEIISEEEHARAVRHAQYGGFVQGLRANAEAALSYPTFGATDIAARALGGPKLAADMRARREEFPTSTKVTGGLAMLGTALLTEGASEAAGAGLGAAEAGTAAEAGLGAARALPGALEGAGAVARAVTPIAEEAAPGLLRQGVRAFTAPMRGVSAAGDLAQGLVSKLLPEEAHTLAGKVLQGAVKYGARGATEGGIIGGADYLDEQALDPNPSLSGEKLLMAIGHGSLLGLETGGLLGASGEIGRKILGELAPKVRAAAEEQAFKAASPLKRGVRLALDIPGLPEEGAVDEVASKLGGIRAVGREALEKVGIEAGDGPEAIANKAEVAARKAGEEVDGFRTGLDAKGGEGVLVKDVLRTWDRDVVNKLRALPATNRGVLGRLNDLANDLELRAGVLPGMSAEERAAALETGRISFQDAAAYRKRISDQINDTSPGIGQKPGILNTALKGMRATFEDEIEAAGERAAKKLGDTTWLDGYKAAKLSYQKLALYDAIAKDGLIRKVANRNLSLTDYLVGGGSGIGLAALGHPLAAAGSLASAVAHKVVRERGNATAAVVMDKIAALGAVRKAISLTDRETARGIQRAVGNEERVAPRLKLHSFDYKAKRDAVLNAAQNADEHADDIQTATTPFAAHSPNVANAFHLTAIRATTFLAAQLPKPKDETLERMTPKLADFQPTSVARAKFERQFNAVHDPVSVLHGCSTGSVTLDEVDAIQNTHPEWLADTREKLKNELADIDKPLPYARRIALSKFLGEPVDPTMRPAFIASIQKGHQDRPMPQTAPKPNSADKPTPKADKLSFASASQLHIGGSRENA